MEDALDRDHTCLKPLVECFSFCRQQPQRVARTLHIDQHPDLQHIVAQGLHPTMYLKTFHAIVYRSDVEAPAMNLQAQQKTQSTT